MTLSWWSCHKIVSVTFQGAVKRLYTLLVDFLTTCRSAGYWWSWSFPALSTAYTAERSWTQSLPGRLICTAIAIQLTQHPTHSYLGISKFLPRKPRNPTRRTSWPNGPLLFCQCLQPFLESIIAPLRIGYMDDLTFGGPTPRIAQVIEDIQRLGEPLCSHTWNHHGSLQIIFICCFGYLECTAESSVVRPNSSCFQKRSQTSSIPACLHWQ